MRHRPHLPSARAVLGAMTAAAIAAAAACKDTTAPSNVRPTSDLTFLRPAPDAPPLANPTVSFYAVRGQDREASIWYRPRTGSSDSTEFLEFKVPGAALVSRPDGTPIAAGDSLQITITVSDPQRLIADFQPSGLRFDPQIPARLKIRFAEANSDYDGDGQVDAADTTALNQLSLWRQEAAGQPWYKVFSAVVEDLKEVDADISGFTGYAIAF